MQAMLGISLYSYPYLKLAKTLCLSYYYLCLLFNKIGKKGQNRFCLKVWGVWRRGKEWGMGGEMAQTMYAHMNK
jgi:hypothetical protein